MFCEKCKSKNIEKEKDYEDPPTGDLLQPYTCKECGHEGYWRNGLGEK